MMKKILSFYTKYFFVWVVLFGIAAYFWPRPFERAGNFNLAHLTGIEKLFENRSFVQRALVRNLSGNNLFFFLTMFGIGAVLQTEDFKRIARKPAIVAVGSFSQFLVMPFGAFLIAKLFGLGPLLTAGLVLTGAAPGAMASNVMCYISKADTAYSVSLTTVSTLLCPVLTPALTLFLAGTQVPVEFWAMFIDIMWMVIVPVIIGFAVRHYFDTAIEKIEPVFPAISVTFIIFICSVVIALNRQRLYELTIGILAAVLILNVYGMTAGYGIGRLFRLPMPQRRTLSIEIGMQNAGLGVTLARSHLGPEAMIPAAIFVFVCILTAALMSEIWQRKALNK